MTTVEESIAAYRVCETRINAVQQALDAAFAEEDSIEKSDI
jgi:exodeoxyribonuclease VII small subunit